MINGHNTEEKSEAALDEIVIARADNMSAWEQPVLAKREILSEASSLTKGKIFFLLEKTQDSLEQRPMRGIFILDLVKMHWDF